MKYLVILTDGAADEPIAEFNGKTAFQAANKPNIDALGKMSRMGMLKTVPDSLHPGSEVANMTIMGYETEKLYQGRGVLEAAAIGIDFEPTDLVMRCNVCTVEGDILVNHSGGHITTEEAGELIDELNDKLGSDRVHFYKGVSYRHILIIKGGKNDFTMTPPHDVPGAKIKDVLPKSDIPSETKDLITDLMLRSRAVLEAHPVNQRRKAAGKCMANTIWPWSAGFKPSMPTLQQMFPQIKTGAVISAVDLIFGIGRLGGLNPIQVEGATGLYNTNFEGKAQATIEALNKYDYVYLHMEAPDEAGHEGKAMLKKQTIEDIDKKVVGPILNAVDLNNTTIALLPDHPTPCAIKTHTNTEIPFILYKPGNKADGIEHYDEVSALNGSYGHLVLTDFMKEMMK
ncbi:MAG: cofactor-independent phosphoglycerate mutase [Marinilabiliaceae bacterium]|nr:cofactor-independent phosphoglycerate mutase [Marinilabiliaceae bacterium]